MIVRHSPNLFNFILYTLRWSYVSYSLTFLITWVTKKQCALRWTSNDAFITPICMITHDHEQSRVTNGLSEKSRRNMAVHITPRRKCLYIYIPIYMQSVSRLLHRPPEYIRKVWYARDKGLSVCARSYPLYNISRTAAAATAVHKRLEGGRYGRQASWTRCGAPGSFSNCNDYTRRWSRRRRRRRRAYNDGLARGAIITTTTTTPPPADDSVSAGAAPARS